MSENPNPNLPAGDHLEPATSGLYPPPHLRSMRLPDQIDEAPPPHAMTVHDATLEHYQDHCSTEDEHMNEVAVDVEAMEGDVNVEGGGLGIMVAPGVGNQLTLSFQGEVYVFDSVSPDRVQAVLLLLGGRELNSAIPSAPTSCQPANKRSNFPQRIASLMRFREKKKERNFDKKIRYAVRKEVALRMQRNKGQFTSSKPKSQDADMGVANWDSTQQWGADDRPQAASSCHHCRVSSHSTPMMRRGPDGARTLCNACGLMWANKGTLRDLSRNASTPARNASALDPSGRNDSNGTIVEPLSVIPADDIDAQQ